MNCTILEMFRYHSKSSSDIHQEPLSSYPLSYLALYIAVVSASALMASLGYVVFVYGTLRASRVIHQLLITTLLNSTFRCVNRIASIVHVTNPGTI